MDIDFFNQRVDNQNVIDLVHTSCVGALSQCLREMKDLGLLRSDAEVFLTENHAFQTDVPKTDVLLFNGFSCEEEDKIYHIGFQVGVSMFEDVNLHRHYKALSYLYDRFEILGSFSLFDNNLNKIGNATILDGKLLSPVSRVDIRCIQMFTVDCVCDLTRGANSVTL